jgi:hypothetical protein
MMTESPSSNLDLDTALDERIEHRTQAALLFNAIVMISGLLPHYFPEDQQKEARVLIKEVKEKLRRLRSLLGTAK